MTIGRYIDNMFYHQKIIFGTKKITVSISSWHIDILTGATFTKNSQTSAKMLQNDTL